MAQTRPMNEGVTTHKNAAIERLLEDEARSDLWAQTILGYPVYPLLRLTHYRRLLLELGGTTIKERAFRDHAPHMSSRVRTSLRGAVRGLSERLEGHDVWVLSSSNYRRKDEMGRFENIFTGHLRKQLGERTLFLEKNLVNLPDQERTDLVFVDALHWAALAAGKLLARGLGYAVSDDAARSFAPTSRQRLAALALYGHSTERVYSALVERHKPKAVFVLNSYSEFVPAQRVIKRCGIPLIEIQHGIVHHSHPGYAYPGSPVLSHAPDHIVTFGARFGQILEETSPYWKGRWSVGGHGWLQKRAAEAQLTGGARRVVLFSQPEPDVQLQVDRMASEVRRSLPLEFEVVLKPHPNERNTSTIYAEAIASGVRLAGAIDDSYSLLAQCSVAVSVYSTVALEALAFPCVSAVVRSPRWTEEIRAFVELGQLAPVDEATDVAKLALEGARRETANDSGRALFGIGEQPPDFERLIAEVTAKLRNAR